MGKVVAAIGMILLALEDQSPVNQAGQIRERHAREEMEAYTRLNLSRRRVEDFDRQSTLICQSIVSNSRFTQAALILLQGSGQYRLAGAAGFDDATVNALEALATRIPVTGFLAPGSVPPPSNTPRPSISISILSFFPAMISAASSSPPCLRSRSPADPQLKELSFSPGWTIPTSRSAPSIYFRSKSLPRASSPHAARP